MKLLRPPGVVMMDDTRLRRSRFREVEVMNMRNRNRILTAAVAAGLPLVAFSLPASAQQRVNQDGRALDANTRVGSDGSNDPRNGLDRRDQTVTGNQVVTGNVSGNRSF